MMCTWVFGCPPSDSSLRACSWSLTRLHHNKRRPGTPQNSEQCSWSQFSCCRLPAILTGLTSVVPVLVCLRVMSWCNYADPTCSCAGTLHRLHSPQVVPDGNRHDVLQGLACLCPGATKAAQAPTNHPPVLWMCAVRVWAPVNKQANRMGML
jgi:hypothetical protein